MSADVRGWTVLLALGACNPAAPAATTTDTTSNPAASTLTVPPLPRAPSARVDASATPSTPVVGSTSGPAGSLPLATCQHLCQRANTCKLETFWGLQRCIEFCTTKNWAVFTCLAHSAACDLIAECLDP